MTTPPRTWSTVSSQPKGPISREWPTSWAGREAGITAPLLAAAYAHQRLCGSHGDLRTPSRLPLDATAISLVKRAGSRLLIYRGGPDELAASAWSRDAARLPTRHLLHARLDQADRHDHGPVRHREVETSPNRSVSWCRQWRDESARAYGVKCVGGGRGYRTARRTEWGASSTSCARMGRHRKHAVRATLAGRSPAAGRPSLPIRAVGPCWS
jgi:hypothetical protein